MIIHYFLNIDDFSSVADPDPQGSVYFWEADPNRSKGKIPKLLRLKMELWKAGDDHIGGVEVQNAHFGASASFLCCVLQVFIISCYCPFESIQHLRIAPTRPFPLLDKKYDGKVKQILH